MLSSVTDLTGEIWLPTMEEYLQDSAEEKARQMARVMSKYITVAYYEGANAGKKETRGEFEVSSIKTKRLEDVVDELAPVLELTFGTMAGELVEIIKDGVVNRAGQDVIADRLKEHLSSRFGKVIPFRNKGRERVRVKVSPSGRMSWEHYTVQHNIEMPVDQYADTLARTSAKKAYNQGHIASYEAAGLKKWRYSCVCDAVSRPHHVALHGHIFTIGTESERKALAVMGEANCRCRAVPHFGDERDTPAGQIAEEQARWAKEALGTLPEKSPVREYLSKVHHYAQKRAGKN